MQVKQGKIIVRAPDFVKDAFIETFLQEKSAWLKSKISAQQQVINKYFDFSHGSQVLLLGKKVKLKICDGKKGRVFTEVDKDGNRQTHLTVVISERHRIKLTDIDTFSQQVKKQLESYFKEQAEYYISTRLKALSKQTYLTPKQIKIRRYRARWGSCNSHKELSFNYLLIMTPTWVIDYVIIHELCHLKHLNHSTDFWQLVAKYCPYYQDAKQWLSSNQSDLVWQLP